MLSETGQTEKDKSYVILLIRGIYTIQQTSDYIREAADSQIWRTG